MKARLVEADFTHLKPKSKEEIQQMIKSDAEFHVHDNTINLYDLYSALAEQKPHVKQIIENIFHTSPRYAIISMRRDKYGRLTFWFHQSMGVWINDEKTTDILLKYKVSLEVPGNQGYNFCISMNG